MPIHTLQTIPQEPEETSFFSGLLEGLALDSGESPARLALHFCLLSVTFYTFYLALGPAGILVAAVIILLRRYLLREDLCEDWAETCCCEQSSYEAESWQTLPQRDAHLVRRVAQSDPRPGLVRPHLRARTSRRAGAVPMMSVMGISVQHPRSVRKDLGNNNYLIL